MSAASADLDTPLGAGNQRGGGGGRRERGITAEGSGCRRRCGPPRGQGAERVCDTVDDNAAVTLY